MGIDADQALMTRALGLARTAERLGEVPVGCVIAREGEVIAEAHNAPISVSDPTGHAEVRALRLAGTRLGNYRLPDCDLYVTLEPCAMCTGAMIHARLRRLVFGAADPRTGAAGSAINLTDGSYGNHRLEVTGGVLADEASAMLRTFFRARR